ncbi:MAG: hypothetical protein ACKN9W_20305 [Methylococcus sp.]
MVSPGLNGWPLALGEALSANRSWQWVVVSDRIAGPKIRRHVSAECNRQHQHVPRKAAYPSGKARLGLAVRTLEVFERRTKCWGLAQAWPPADDVAAPPFSGHRLKLDDRWLPPAPGYSQPDRR